MNVSVSPHFITLPEDSFGLITTSASSGVPPYIYNWTPATNITCGSCPIVTVMGTGDTVKYIYTVYDQSGCAGSDTLWVFSAPCMETAAIPNVFSPNGDDRNDLFFIPGVCPKDDFSLQIFDRWGSLLFNSVSRNHGWNGKTDHGEDAPDGTYYFVVKVEKQTYRGFLQLVR
jgi:gliding motility-associated-like protein